MNVLYVNSRMSLEGIEAERKRWHETHGEDGEVIVSDVFATSSIENSMAVQETLVQRRREDLIRPLGMLVGVRAYFGTEIRGGEPVAPDIHIKIEHPLPNTPRSRKFAVSAMQQRLTLGGWQHDNPVIHFDYEKGQDEP